MELALLWLQLVGAAAVILVSSNFLTKSADVIAFKTGLGRSFIGVVMLATATSLPELGTGVSSVTFLGAPDIAAGDAFGSNIFNLFIIGLLDIFWRRGPILNSVSLTSALVGALGIGVIALAIVAILIHDLTTSFSNWFISPISLIMLAAFILAMYLIYRMEQSQPQDGGGEVESAYADSSLAKAGLFYVTSAAIMVGSAIWLAGTGDSIAEVMGLEASFIGTQFVAASTSLPELAASFAAIRINAPELAITNVLGSNLFNMGFILFLDDLALTSGIFWESIAPVHSLTAVFAIVMTAVVMVGLLSRPRNRPGKFWTVEALFIIGLYLLSSLLVFQLA
jgi:cation:H+ antiporter